MDASNGRDGTRGSQKRERRKRCGHNAYVAIDCQMYLICIAIIPPKTTTTSSTGRINCSVAQRQRVGLITQRSKDRNLPEQLLLFLVVGAMVAGRLIATSWQLPVLLLLLTTRIAVTVQRIAIHRTKQRRCGSDEAMREFVVGTIFRRQLRQHIQQPRAISRHNLLNLTGSCLFQSFACFLFNVFFIVSF